MLSLTMPPKKGPRKSMPARINRAPTLTPSRRSARAPPPHKSPGESSPPSKTLNIATASPQDTSINFRFYTPKSAPKKTVMAEPPPETPSSHRRAFKLRPSRLSTVYTPAAETPATNNNSRRTRRSAALETPKMEAKEASDLEIPDSVESSESNFELFAGNVGTKGNNLGTKGYADALSSPTSTPDMRNSSRVRKPTRRAIESLETSKKGPRRKNTPALVPTVEEGAKAVKNNVPKKPAQKTRTSKRMANSNLRKDDESADPEAEIRAVAKLMYDLVVKAHSPDFVLRPDYPEFIAKLRADYYRSRDQDKLGAAASTDQSTGSNDIDMVDQDTSDAPDITLTPFARSLTDTTDAGIFGFKKRSEAKITDDGWVESGHFNHLGEEISIIPPDYHPHVAVHSYGYEGLPWPPVRARSTGQATAEYSHGFPPLLGNRNIPAMGLGPFVLENVKEEKARILANAPPAAPAAKDKKPRARKRRHTEAISGGTNSEEASASAPAQTPAAPGERKSQRRRRQTAPAPTNKAEPSPALLVAAAEPAAAEPAAAEPATKSDKPKVQQRLRLTLKPAKADSPAGASVSVEAPAEQPASPAPSSAASPAKRRRRRG
ncbi:unnamed protein product [Penicillium olsonii]|nr:unnamed protein product [Penicillium olsonii]